MAAHPGRLADYARYRTRVRRIVWGHVIVRAEGDERVRSATIAPAGPDWAPAGRERTFEVDAVCTAYGFTPVRRPRPRARLRAARRRGRPRRGHAHERRPACSWPARRPGIGGADLALRRGRAGRSCGRRARRRDLTALRRRRAKLAGFAQVLTDLFDPRPGLVGSPTPDTVLCRCEDVTAGAIDAAIAGGATTMSALKIVTRCGQGPCQGRICERLVCERLPEPERFSARAPIRPIPLDVLMDSSSTA